ncbi:helix-hairpin-helix domain-containing protein [Chryseobacterium aquaticum]|uniref:helix-hairpin-helix domain-containing protein n=1 Tax=Chryseobacterium aquaticum TaxID=452084 RepID=UPI003F6F73EE
MNNKKEKAIQLLEEVLLNLENSKISLLSIIQKLNRIGKLLDEKKLIGWTEIQLGNTEYKVHLTNLVDSYVKNEKLNTKETKKYLNDYLNLVKDKGIIDFIDNEELTAKAQISGGQFENIGFIEQRYNDIVKGKRGNDGTYYQSNLSNTLAVVKSIAYKKASFYHKKYAYESLPETNFELLKSKVDDKLLDLEPHLVEQLMLAFKGVSSDNKEEWSQALTSCRRFFEKLADSLYPATDKKNNGRSLAQNNYINRIWAFLDESIESDSNKEIAKKHIDYLGSYFQSLYKITNKGVHTEITRIEALKTVMHLYLVCVDILDFVKNKKKTSHQLTIYTATLDELEAIGNVNRKIAKEIIKLRVSDNKITKEKLLKVPGLGTKTLEILLKNISL